MNPLHLLKLEWSKYAPSGTFAGGSLKRHGKNGTYVNKGRYPCNVILDEETAALLDAQVGRPVSRFYYCPKATSKEKDAGQGDTDASMHKL